MALLIEADCINCGVCEPECPTYAISPGEDFYVIDPNRCTECVADGTPHCQSVCPVDCIVLDPNHQEDLTQRQAKLEKLSQEDPGA